MNRLHAVLFKFVLFFIIYQSKAQDPITKGLNKSLSLSPLGIKSMPYRSFRIRIFIQDIDEARYFYSPTALLDHRSAACHLNNVTGAAELRFVVHLWDDALEVRLAEHLRNVLNRNVTKDNLEIIPFERIAMDLEINKQPLELQKFNIQRMLFRYRQEKYVWLRANCLSIQKCQRMAEEMKLDAAQFSDLQLKFILGPQKRQMKEITVKQSDIAFGNLFSRIELKFRRQHYALLTRSDAKRLVSEIVDKVIVANFDDNEVIADDSNIYPLLEQQLFIREERSLSNNDCCSSIYWENENIGLGQLTNALNQLYNKSDSYGQQKLRDAFSQTTLQDSTETDFDDIFKDFFFTTEIASAHLLRNSLKEEDESNKSITEIATRNADGKKLVFLNASVLLKLLVIYRETANAGRLFSSQSNECQY